MTHNEYIAAYDQVVAGMREITVRKNSDYASDADAFQNFRLTEHLGVTDTARGILVRMCDKFQRICNLIGGEEAAVLDEKIYDTLKDLANYAIILLIYMSERDGEIGSLDNELAQIDADMLKDPFEIHPKSEVRWNPAAVGRLSETLISAGETITFAPYDPGLSVVPYDPEGDVPF